MNITKIFKSFSFQNNKIIDAKTDLPTHEDHIIPRKYVDNETIYKTPKVLQYVNPFKLEWVTNPVNKNVLQIFDDIFFPLINPEYFNPKFDYFRIEQINKPGNDIIFTETTNRFKIFWKIITNDRLSTQTGRILITKNDNSTISINTNSTNLTDEFEFDVNYTNISKIEFVKVFNPTTVTKNDSYGNPYTPADFQLLYELKYDITFLLGLKSIIIPSMLFRKIALSEDINVLIDQILSISNRPQLITDMNFIKSNNYINVNSGGNNFYLLMIPKSITDYFLLMLERNIVPYSIIEITNPHTIDSVVYNIYGIDLGYHQTNKILNLSFLKI